MDMFLDFTQYLLSGLLGVTFPVTILTFSPGNKTTPLVFPLWWLSWVPPLRTEDGIAEQQARNEWLGLALVLKISTHATGWNTVRAQVDLQATTVMPCLLMLQLGPVAPLLHQTALRRISLVTKESPHSTSKLIYFEALCSFFWARDTAFLSQHQATGGRSDWSFNCRWD